MMRPNSFMGNVHIQCPIQFKALISPSPGKPWAFNCAHGVRNLNLSRLGWGIEKEVPNLSSRIQALGWLGHLNTIFSPGQEGGGKFEQTNFQKFSCRGDFEASNIHFSSHSWKIFFDENPFLSAKFG